MASISGSKDVIDETSPDLLKNTPSNIRRLADEIEHLEGRQKYLAQTRSPSDGGDLRWYFCKMPLAVNRCPLWISLLHRTCCSSSQNRDSGKG
ncbi:hypothetical protein BC332_31819 [Capsicum chinense]|nr:hypothetical protein BC332_31819 [Capsicum chinense]